MQKSQTERERERDKVKEKEILKDPTTRQKSLLLATKHVYWDHLAKSVLHIYSCENRQDTKNSH